MAWTLKQLSSGGVTLQTFTNADADPGVRGGFRAVLDPSGNCRTLAFQGRNDVLGLAPGDYIQLSIDGTPIFSGQLVTTPPPGTTGRGRTGPSALEEYHAEGLFQTALEWSVLEAEYRDFDNTAVAAFNLAEGADGVPGLIDFTEANFQTGGHVLDYYKPESQTTDMLRELADISPGTSGTRPYETGVNASMEAFFRPVTTTPASIAYADVRSEAMPATLPNVTTKVRLVVAGTHAGADPFSLLYKLNLDQAEDYHPIPITREVETSSIPEVNIQAVRAIGIPEGFDPFLDQTDISDWGTESLTNFTGTTSHRDGTAATYAAVSSTASAAAISYLFEADHDPYATLVVGFKLLYRATYKDGAARVGTSEYSATLAVEHVMEDGADSAQTKAFYGLPATPEDGRPLWAVVPVSFQFDPLNQSGVSVNPAVWLTRLTLSVAADALDAGDNFQVYEFIPLILNTPLLDRMAESRLRLPGLYPERISVAGYQAPSQYVTLTGYPGGDRTLKAEAFEVVLERGVGLRTFITLDAAAAPPFAVRAANALRSQQSGALYGLMRSERQ